MEWEEVEPGVWLDAGRRWSIAFVRHDGFYDHYRLVNIRTHERSYHNTLKDAQKAAEEVSRGE